MGDTFWVPLIAWLIVGICLLLILTIGIVKARKTGKRLKEAIFGPDKVNAQKHEYWTLIWLIWFILHTYINTPQSGSRTETISKFIIPGIDIALALVILVAL